MEKPQPTEEITRAKESLISYQSRTALMNQLLGLSFLFLALLSSNPLSMRLIFVGLAVTFNLRALEYQRNNNELKEHGKIISKRSEARYFAIYAVMIILFIAYVNGMF